MSFGRQSPITFTLGSRSEAIDQEQRIDVALEDATYTQVATPDGSEKTEQDRGFR
jgi:flagellar basal body rod protein FlgG